MRSGHDKAAQTAELLRRKIRLLDVRSQQTLSHDGETAQPRAGRRRTGLRENGSRAGRGIYVSRTGVGRRRYPRNLCGSSRQNRQFLSDRTPRRGLRRAPYSLCGRNIHGPLTVFHYRQKWPFVCPSFPEAQQLARQEPLHLRQLQHDERAGNLQRNSREGTAPAHGVGHVYPPRTARAQARPRKRTLLQRGYGAGTDQYGHHALHRRPHQPGQRAQALRPRVGRRLRALRRDGQRRDDVHARPLGHQARLLV